MNGINVLVQLFVSRVVIYVRGSDNRLKQCNNTISIWCVYLCCVFVCFLFLCFAWFVFVLYLVWPMLLVSLWIVQSWLPLQFFYRWFRILWSLFYCWHFKCSLTRLEVALFIRNFIMNTSSSCCTSATVQPTCKPRKNTNIRKTSECIMYCYQL
jgi:hypothetical protein